MSDDFFKMTGGAISLDDLPDQPAERQPDQIKIDLTGLPDDNASILDGAYRRAQMSPDEAAKVHDLARRTGLPPVVVRANQAEAQRRAAKPDWNALEAEAPLTVSELVKNAQFFAVAHDDTANLSAIEKALGYGQKGGAALLAAGPRFNAAAWGVAESGADFLSTYLTGPLAGRLLPEDIGARMAGTFRRYRQVQSGFADDIRRHEAGAGPIESSVYSGLESLGLNLLTLPASVATGNPSIALAGMSATTGGLAYGQARDAGRDPTSALTFAASQAAIEFAAEKLPVSALIGDLKAGSPLWKMLVHQTATEVPGEQVATVLQDLNEWAVINPDRSFADYLAERPSAAAQTLISTLVSVGGQTTIVKAFDAAVQRASGQVRAAEAAQRDAQVLEQLTGLAQASKLRQRDPAAFEAFVGQIAGDGADVMIDARQFVDALAQSGIDVAEVTLHAPSVQAQLQEALATGGDLTIPLPEFAARIAGTDAGRVLLPHVRTHPEAMTPAEAQAFFQDNPDLAAHLEGEMTRLAAENAADLGEPAPNPVREAILAQLTQAGRFVPDVNAAYADLLSAFFTTMAERVGVTPEALAQQFPVSIVSELNLGGGPVLDDLLNQAADPTDLDFTQAGTPLATDTTGAQPYGPEQTHRTVGEPAGFGSATDRPDAGGRRNVHRDVGGGRPAQGWTRATRIRRADGEPAAVYRGAALPLSRDHFAPEALGVASGNPSSGLGVWFTGSRSEAARFGETSAHYLDLRNPKVIRAEQLPGFDTVDDAITFREALRRAGYDGIVLDARHLGGGVHFVAFSPEQVITDERLAQDRRGFFDPASRTIGLLQAADLSTFLHESGHFFLEVMTDIASRPDAPEQVRADMATVLQWFGVDSLDAWRAMPLDEKRPYHERFARGFEAYAFEGEAPSLELQGVFARFRAWLLRVYRQITRLNVELTDDVRQVFARMLATDEQIKIAEAARSYRPLFETAEAGGMTAQDFARYQALGGDATAEAKATLERRSLRDMRWLANAKGRKLRELQREAAEKRKSVRDEIAAEMRREPVYAAMRFLRYGELPEGEKVEGGKLSLEVLRDLYGDGPAAPWRYLGTGPHGLAATEGLHPDQVAELFGFGSGDELLRRLLAADPWSVALEARTDQRMLERFGDLTDPQAIERAAEAAIHNEARARFVAAEVAALQQAKGDPLTLARAARQYAEQAIARRKVRDIRPAQFAAAESKAGRQAEAAFKAGNVDQAASAKRSQLLNGRLAKVAGEALDEIEAAVRYLKGFERDGTRKSLDTNYLDQIDQLLERFDLRVSVTNKELRKRAGLAAWVDEMRAHGFEPAIDDDLLNEARRQHYRDMTLEEFRGLVDAVKNIEHLGRLKKRLLTAKDQREFDAAVAEAAATIRENARKTLPDRIESNTWLDAARHNVKAFFAEHRKFASLVREMDGLKDGGPLWELFVRPMNERGDFEATEREKATRRLTELFAPILAEGKLRHKTFIPTINRSLSREGRLAIALNWGNETNRARVMEGERWTPAQVQAVLDTLSKAEWDFVQGVWDYIDTYWPAIADKERRVSGLPPAKVEPLPVSTKWGQYRGGYYPIKYDPQRSSKAEADSVAETLKQAMQGLYTRATTRRGHTKARVESVLRPVRKDLGVIFEHVDQVIHDLAWHEWLIDANRLLGAKQIDQAIREHYGPEVLHTMKEALKDIAVGELPAQLALHKALNHLRTGATIAGLGWNLSTALMQPLGLTQSMVRIGPQWVARGVAKWLGSAARMENTVATIYAKSEFMRLRGKTLQREINEIRNRVRGKSSAIEASYFYLIQKFQMVADVPTWLGMYEKALAEGADEARAVALADQAVLDAQGGGQVKDLAEIQRGHPLFKLFTNFYSYFNTTYNLTAESVARTDFRNPASVGRLAVDFLLLYTIPAVLGALIRAALQGDLDDEDELAERLIREQLGYLLGTMVGLRELGDAVQGFQGYRGPPGMRFFAETTALAKQVEQGEADEALLDKLNAAGGILFHYPAGQVERTARGVAAIADGEAGPQALIVGPPRD